MFYTLSQQITKPIGKLTLLAIRMSFPNVLLFELPSIIVTVILKHLINSKVTKTIFTK